MKYSSIPFFNYTLFNDSLSKLISSERLLISTINQYSFCVAQKDSDFSRVLTRSDVLLPDGVAITAASNFLTGRSIKKIAGSDLHVFLLEYLHEKNGKCFYLGSCPSTLNKIKERLEREYPNIQARFYSPPYKTVFSDAESREMIGQVNAFQPEVLFIGMTAPKQEKWAYQYKDSLDARLICSVGAVFDFYAGTVKRPGQIWINLGLEWLGRLLKEPRRLWKRYLYYGPQFIGQIIFEKWKFMFSKKKELHY